MNVIAWMDRYRKEVIEVGTWKHGIKGSVSLQYNESTSLPKKYIKGKEKY